jgi:aspartate/methionine/tyrosine aminotransferase
MSRIKPAARLGGVSEYYFSRKLKEVAEMNARGLDVISLGVGSPDLPPSGAVIEELCRAARRGDVHGYQPYVGIPELRRAMVEWYAWWYGVVLDPDREILPLIGSKEGVMHLSLALLNPGDGVLVPNPGYPTYGSVSRLVGARVVLYNLKEERGWYPDFGALGDLDLSTVKMMWLNYPHMPTGAPASRKVFEEAVAFGHKHGIVICHDNPYSFILNDRPQSILEVDGAREVAVELNSLSKSHNMPGWRVAMLASNEWLVEWVLRVKSNVDSGQFRPVMLGAAEALRASKEWYEEMNGVYGRRRRLGEKIFEALGCGFDPGQGGMFLWGRVPDTYIYGVDLADAVLQRARVFIVPGAVFGSMGERYVRLSLCCRDERLEEALERIKNMNRNKF